MSRAVIMAGWDDVAHLSDSDKADLLKSLPPHQKNARSKGIPSMGAGAIYPIEEEEILCEPFPIPAHFCKIYGLDTGWKKTAGIFGAWDKDQDVVYLYSEHYRGQSEPSVHAAAIKARGEWIPGEIDYAGANISDGTKIWQLYKKLGLNVVPADKGVEAGIQDVYERLSTGRLKVFTTLQHLRSEYRLYRRNEKGFIVKEHDHLMDAMRYLVRGLRHAKTQPVAQIYTHNPIGDKIAGY